MTTMYVTNKDQYSNKLKKIIARKCSAFPLKFIYVGGFSRVIVLPLNLVSPPRVHHIIRTISAQIYESRAEVSRLIKQTDVQLYSATAQLKNTTREDKQI